MSTPSPYPWSRERQDDASPWDIVSAEGKFVAAVAHDADALVVEHTGEMIAVLEQLCLSPHTVAPRDLLLRAMMLLSYVKPQAVRVEEDGEFSALTTDFGETAQTVTADIPPDIARAQTLYRTRGTRTICRITWTVQDRSTGEVLKCWDNERVVGGSAFIPDAVGTQTARLK